MKKPLRVLVILSDNPYGRSVLLGIHQYSRAHGRWDLHIESDQRADVLSRTRFSIKHWKADAVIASIIDLPMERMLIRSGLPTVNLSGYYQSRFPTVMSDGVEVGRAVARYFLDNGSRSFAYCSRTIELAPQLRCDGFVEELSRAGYTCDVFTDHFINSREHNWVRNRRRMDQWLLTLPRPVAVMCSNEPKGQQVSRACQRLGLRVPDDMALLSVGHDDVVCRVLNPPLSLIETNPDQIGYEAAHLLHRILRRRRIPAKPILIPPGKIWPRGSSDIIAVDDPDIAAAVRYLRDHAHELISVKELLREIPISRRAMERRFEKAIGRTPKAEIMRIRINKAKELLSETSLRGSDISARLGFSSPEKFSATFRRKTGKTPMAFRDASRQRFA